MEDGHGSAAMQHSSEREQGGSAERCGRKRLASAVPGVRGSLHRWAGGLGLHPRPLRRARRRGGGRWATSSASSQGSDYLRLPHSSTRRGCSIAAPCCRRSCFAHAPCRRQGAMGCGLRGPAILGFLPRPSREKADAAPGCQGSQAARRYPRQLVHCSPDAGW